MELETKMKRCPKCSTEKPKSEFNKRKASKDGLNYWCRPCDHATTKNWLVLNRDKHLERQKVWAGNNKERKAINSKTYAQNNRHIENARNARRKAAKNKATPAWSDLSAIADFYLAAIAFRIYTGQEYHVDHIVPLQGKTVCGLHVLENLQILTASENLSKQHRYWPQMWGIKGENT
jgi:hypothetical protein